MTPQQVHDVILDATNPARKEIVRIGLHLRDVLKRDLSENALCALDELESWHAEGSPSCSDVPGADVAMGLDTMFRFVNTDLAFIYGGGESGLSHFLKTVGRRFDEDPQADVTTLEQVYVDRLLAQAWTGTVHNGRQEGGRPAGQGRQSAASRPAMGFGQSLDGFPSVDSTLDLPMPPLRCVDGATIFSQAAQAYVQWVPLHDVDGAKSLLPPGQSERADNPARTVNVDGWVKGELHPAPITRQVVERMAVTKRSL